MAKGDPATACMISMERESDRTFLPLFFYVIVPAGSCARRQHEVLVPPHRYLPGKAK